MIDVLSLTQWRVSPVPADLTIRRVGDMGLLPVVVGVDGDVLTLHPGASAGTSYTLGGETVLVPANLAPQLPRPTHTGRLPVSTMLHVMGRAFQRLDGVPTAKLIRAWQPGDTQLFVSSPLPFADSGVVFVGAARFSYTSRTHGSLDGVSPLVERLEPLGVGTLVQPDWLLELPHDRQPAGKPEVPPEPPETLNTYVDF